MIASSPSQMGGKYGREALSIDEAKTKVNGKYRLIDGYHRFIMSNKDKINVICGE
jgi:hypothetical protein